MSDAFKFHEKGFLRNIYTLVRPLQFSRFQTDGIFGNGSGDTEDCIEELESILRSNLSKWKK